MQDKAPKRRCLDSDFKMKVAMEGMGKAFVRGGCKNETEKLQEEMDSNGW